MIFGYIHRCIANNKIVFYKFLSISQTSS